MEVVQPKPESQRSSPPTAECWCGGRGYETKFRDDYSTWERYCVCEKGRMFRKEEYDRRAAINLEKCGIPSRLWACEFDTYPPANGGRELVQKLKDWFIEDAEGKGFFLYGDYGTGKSALASAWLRANLADGEYQGKFITVPDLLSSIRATYGPNAERGEWELMKEVREIDMLVLDDIGAERPTDWVVERLFAIINHRHSELLPTFFTSNLALPELAERLGERTTWRIAEMSEVIHVTGANLRNKKR